METLKIRFKLHELEFEVEGHHETAKEEFRNFNENILNTLLSKINIAQSSFPNGQNASLNEKFKQIPEATLASEIDISQYPILKDVKLRDLPKSESEWLLIYSFYASDFGSKEFAKEDFLKLYESTDRKTDGRIGNLTNNLKTIVSHLYIKSTNDTSFILLQKGKDKAIEILEGKSIASNQVRGRKKLAKNKKNDTVEAVEVGNDKSDEKAQSKEKIKSKSKVDSSIPFVDLRFKMDEMNSLIDYFKIKSPIGQNDEVAVALDWFCQNKNSEGATIEEIKYLIKIATAKVPTVLSQVLINMKGPKFNFIEKSSEGKFLLTSLGVLHVSKDLPKISN